MADLKPKYGFNPEPRLSANQLAEYLSASPTRRKTIVKDAKFPKTVVVAHYNGAYDAITKFLCDTARSPSHLNGAVAGLQLKAGDQDISPWAKNDAQLSIEAISAFYGAYNALGVAGVECRPVLGSQPRLSMSGVEISVALDVTVHKKERVGGAVLLFSKAEQSTKERAERGKTAAILASLFSQQYLTYLGDPDRKLCMSLDVFAGKGTLCPASFKTAVKHMEGSCEEVALRWPTTQPPADYDGPGY